MSDTRISLPLGRAIYPALKHADTKFHDLGIYKCNVSVPLKEATSTMEKLTEIHKRHTGKAPTKAENTMWKMEVDEETGEETGNVVFKCSVKNVRRRDGELWDRRPKQFDAKMNPVDLNPYGGTELYVSASIYEWSAGGKKGVSLQPLAVQIINLVEGGAGSGENFGFQKQDGFEGETTEYKFGTTDDTAQEEEVYDDF
ncbi:single-stranded DNA-binding protein [Roseobacter phage CRP-118]|uniref:Single-stranded DNA-binding protein n=1 Tax=Roseobacter phage CRP-118 TaxID=3072843 RepID=A0AAX4G2I7_9CAUD|nr:single-stranded DNA-binding protein [Roseobacter phage CRP-118]